MSNIIAIILTFYTFAAYAQCRPSVGEKTDLGFELILGENSTALFDYLETDQVAGLLKKDALLKVDSTSSAFIAGLTNLYKSRLFVFLNLKRVRSEHSIIVHESVHMAKVLLTLKYHPDVDLEKDNYVVIDDSLEEEYAEMVELIYEKIVGEFFFGFNCLWKRLLNPYTLI